MAKSLRSKWKRKMRNIKRERYSQKEMARLKKMLGVRDGPKDVEMKDLSALATVSDANAVKRSIEESKKKRAEREKSAYNPVTLKDKFGHYPEWLGSSYTKKMKKLNKAYKKEKREGKKKKRSKVAWPDDDDTALVDRIDPVAEMWR